MDFSNRNILITGAADGLGFAVSKAFSEKRANAFDITGMVFFCCSSNKEHIDLVKSPTSRAIKK